MIRVNSDLEIQCPLNGIVAGVESMEEVKNKKSYIILQFLDQLTS